MTAQHRKTDNGVSFSVRDIFRRRFSKKIEYINPFIIKGASDNLGNSILSVRNTSVTSLYCKTYDTLKVGDNLEFQVYTETDDSDSLEYSLDVDYKNVIIWQQSNRLKLKILDKYVSKFCQVRINVRKVRNFQTIKEIDNSLIFSYNIKL